MSQRRCPDAMPELDGAVGRAAGWVPAPQRTRHVPKGDISRWQKSISRCKIPFWGRRRVGGARAHLPVHTRVHQGGSRRRYGTSGQVQLSFKILC